MGKNGILKNKAGEQIFPATTADQVAWNDRMNLKQAISEKLGAPYAASTVSSMTDRTRIYVYTGDESGYTKGNWYYWNGSSWVSGGVYNSVAVETDKTLTVAGKAADGEVVGQEIGQLKEDIGTLYPPLEDGYVSYTNGSVNIAMDLKHISIRVSPGMQITYKLINKNPDYRGLAFFDSDGKYLSGIQANDRKQSITVQDGWNEVKATVNNVTDLIIHDRIAEAYNKADEAYNKADEAYNKADEANKELEKTIVKKYSDEKQLDIVETQEGYAVKSDGTKENAGWISSLKFNCEAYQKIYTKNAHAHKNYPWIVLYDSNNNVIMSMNMNEDSSAEIIAPNNASYGWMNCYELVSYAQTQYLVTTINNEYLPEKLKKIITESNPLANLLENGGYINIFNKIACIGDSLTEGVFEYTENGEVKYAGKPQGFEPYSYPSQLARMTGATVGNYGVGGATAKSWLETTACTDCFKEENKAQAYIIALGTNDTNYDGDVNTDIDVSNYNNNADTFVGNYAKIIQKCLELQQKAKIFVVTIPKTRTDYHNAWTTGNSKIKAVAEKLGVYVLDIYTYSESFDNPDEYKKHFYLGGHRSAIGYKQTAMEYATYISWIIYNNPDDFRNVQYIGTDYNYTN